MLVAVDTGGTKTLIAGFQPDGSVVAEHKFPTPHDTTDYITTLKKELAILAKGHKIDGIVIALPGIIKDGVAIWCNNLGWKNFNVAAALKGVLGGVPIYVENDANLAGLAEARQLPTTPDLCLYVTVSTGIGSGIIANGIIQPALRKSEIGRSLVEYAGHVREWETFASGSAIVRVYKKYARDIKSKRTWNSIADRISRGFLATIPVLQPDVIIIGGSIGTYYEQYSDELIKLLKTHLPEHIPVPEIRQAAHPEYAVVYGCFYHGRDLTLI
jgi:predicted NBD/HSP70 family sugar kinase